MCLVSRGHIAVTDSVVNELPSVRRADIVFAVILEPTLEGSTQLMVTLKFVLTAVVGAAGTPGMAAALIDTSDEFSLKPTIF